MVMLNKRGFELSWEFIFSLLFIIAIIVMMSIWVGGQSSGFGLQKQILAKEICILIGSADPNTEIIIEHDKKLTIEKKDSGIVVKKGEFDRGYFYDCYLKDNVEFSKKDDFTIIKIN